MSNTPELMEEGIVLDLQGPLATVEVRQGGCAASCGAGCICAADAQQKVIIVQAINRASAQAGQRVRLAMHPNRVLGLAALAYLFPLVLLFAGALAGPTLFAALGFSLAVDPARAITAIVGLVLGFVFLKLIFSRVKPDGSFTPIIIETL
ncbi:MAG: SoxR reducing system RseC family protein [Candidatus Lernaella stagnicola]|nr:SoxR reducing system RseC family protein [Candidatus Lernaella stagnicola]